MSLAHGGRARRLKDGRRNGSLQVQYGPRVRPASPLLLLRSRIGLESARALVRRLSPTIPRAPSHASSRPAPRASLAPTSPQPHAAEREGAGGEQPTAAQRFANGAPLHCDPFASAPHAKEIGEPEAHAIGPSTLSRCSFCEKVAPSSVETPTMKPLGSSAHAHSSPARAVRHWT